MGRIAALSAAAMVLAFGISPSASAETRTFDLPAFDAVTVTSGVDAEIIVGGDQSVRAEAESGDILDKLELSVRNGRLTIEIDRNFLDFIFDGGLSEWFSGGPKVTVHLTTPVLTELEARSGSDVRARGMTGDNLSIDASSGATIDARELTADFVAVDGSSGAWAGVSGTCSRLQGDVSSGAQLSLSELICRDVRVEASSGARASVYATESIEAEASSGGKVGVSGGPREIEVDTSSGGDVDFRGS